MVLTDTAVPKMLIRLLLLSVLAAPAAFAIAAERLVTTDAGDEIAVAVHPADGDTLILWLPSEFGSSPRRVALATTLADSGIEVWLPDLHGAWFLPAGRYSLNEVDPAAIATLIDAAVGEGRRVFLMADGRTTALALAGVHAWQTSTDDTAGLRGLLTFSPRLFVSTPQGGESAEYLPIAAASNLPVYVLQPENAGGFWFVGDVVSELEKGGASVFLHRLPGASDGFHTRPDFTPAEDKLTQRLPGLLQQAMALLDGYGGTPAQPVALADGARAPQRPQGAELLRPYPDPQPAPALVLDQLGGGVRDLADLRGKVVLVNFWATWCPPCVEEIPSLQRLYRRLAPHGLEILAVDVGESEETMRAFLRDKPIEFPVLMDSDGEALRRWGIYAFPTTLVIDREQRIRYAVFGAFDWSSDEVVRTLRPLLGDD